MIDSQALIPISKITMGMTTLELPRMTHMPCLQLPLQQLHIVVLHFHNVTYGWQDLASDALSAVDIFSGLQVASNTPLPAEAAQHPSLSGAG